MPQRDHLLERLELLNPVPDPDLLDEGLEAARRLRLNIAQRKEAEMTETETPRLNTVPELRARRRGFALGVVALLAVVAAGAALYLAVIRDADGFDVAAAAPAEIAEEFLHRLAGGDPAGAAALVSDSHSGIRIPTQGRHAGTDGLIDFFGFYEATNVRTEFRNCVEVNSSGIVSCEITIDSGVVEALGLDPLAGAMTFTIGERRIRGVNFTVAGRPLADFAASQDALETWIVEARPDAASDLFEGGDLIKNAETGRRYLQLASEYAEARNN